MCDDKDLAKQDYCLLAREIGNGSLTKLETRLVTCVVTCFMCHIRNYISQFGTYIYVCKFECLCQYMLPECFMLLEYEWNAQGDTNQNSRRIFQIIIIQVITIIFIYFTHSNIYIPGIFDCNIFGICPATGTDKFAWEVFDVLFV